VTHATAILGFGALAVIVPTVLMAAVSLFPLCMRIYSRAQNVDHAVKTIGSFTRNAISQNIVSRLMDANYSSTASTQ
jgi:hypothetical protein